MAVELRPRIVVIGVGGAGGNAVNNMIEANLQGVEFVVANTDAQALVRSKAPTQIQLGAARTSGLGAGANPDVGAEAAKESSDEIKKLLQGAHMCFIAAGMGGGTGTGAAPIIARIAKEQRVLTVGVVTKPFDFEGKRRMAVAERGIVDLRTEVDTLLIIPNQNLFRIANRDTTFAEAFGMADRVLYSGVRGITDLMVMPGLINLDFADVRTVMAGMGTAMMGTGESEGENRALKAAQDAIANPLLDDVSMKGAKGVLINITGGYDMTLFEVDEAANEVRREVDPDAHIILGSTFDENMNGRIRVSVVAAGVSVPAAVAAPAAPARPTFQASPPQVARPDPAPVAYAPPLPDQVAAAAEAAAAEAAAAEAAARAAAEPPAPDPVVEAAPAPEPVRTTPIIRSSRSFAAVEPEDDAPIDMSADVDLDPVQQPAAEPPGRSFATLFGWKKAGGDDVAPKKAAVPEVDEGFDDDLEIPAFLRRSANT